MKWFLKLVRNKRIEALESALKNIIADHDERMKLYPDMNNQEYRVMVMEEARKLLFLD